MDSTMPCLVLGRKAGETVVVTIGNQRMTVQVSAYTEIRFHAPRTVNILRGELTDHQATEGALVLTREPGESFIIRHGKISLTMVFSERTKVAFRAPQTFRIRRSELERLDLPNAA